MKFWQIISLFRDEKHLLDKAFNSSIWESYSEYYFNYSFYVANQRRDILDKIVEGDLVLGILKESKKTVYFSTKERKLFSYKSGFANIEYSLVSAIELFGDENIVDLFERTEISI